MYINSYLLTLFFNNCELSFVLKRTISVFIILKMDQTTGTITVVNYLTALLD